MRDFRAYSTLSCESCHEEGAEVEATRAMPLGRYTVMFSFRGLGVNCTRTRLTSTSAPRATPAGRSSTPGVFFSTRIDTPSPRPNEKFDPGCLLMNSFVNSTGFHVLPSVNSGVNATDAHSVRCKQDLDACE